MSKLLEGLNEAQAEAVTHGGGPLLIIAGAGTGKTKVITHRIAHLITSKKARPEEILAVTFTEKAANEMEERVDLLIPYSYSFVEISTFNSFGERVLRNYGHEIGYAPDFRLLDDVEQAIFFRENLFAFPLHFYRPLSSPTRYIQELLDTIRRLKQEGIKPQEYVACAERLAEEATDDVAREKAAKQLEMARVYAAYQELLEREGKIDFEDQVVLVVDLFRKRKSILQEFQQKYKYILVDEFQDTNSIQFELLKLLAAEHRNLTVVGDDDQSIFRFRGASLSNILNFRKVYPDAKKIVLTENFRSTQSILDSAYRLIQQNNPDRLEVQEKIDKVLRSAFSGEGKSIHMLQLDTLSHEADRVAEIILDRVQQGLSFGDMAILVRRNADADPFLRALNMKNIPFRFSGSRGLYARDEVKILVSFIRALTDFEDSKSLFYLALSEVYALDPYDLSLLANHAHKKHLTLHEVFKKVSQGQSPVEISETSKAKVKGLFEDLMYYVHLAAEQSAGRVIYAFLEKSGFLKSIISGEPIQAEMRTKNIRLFFDKVKNFSELTEEDSVFDFARHLDMLQQVGDNPASAEAELEEDAVNVLTVHKAKGLEFEAVFMVGLIADRFPGRARREKILLPDAILKNDLPSKENSIQEERRLFYVGMTRAKKLLYLTWARDYGLKRLKNVSPFVLEALDLPKAPEEILRSSALEEIRRYAPSPASPERLPEVREKGVLSLSFFQVDDYLSCPLKYKYRHLMRIPVLPHHNVVFGRVLHSVIHHHLRLRKAGKKLSEKGLIDVYEQSWVNEGFLSREHEEMRKKAGEEALRRFYKREEAVQGIPLYLEKEFRWQEGGLKFTGRWDRVDRVNGRAVIIDYKATEVKDQKEADKRTRDSLQMDLYALSWEKTQETGFLETRLHFLESDLIGRASKKVKDLERAAEKILEAEAGIRTMDFRAKPDWHTCSYCDFRVICPDSYAY